MTGIVIRPVVASDLREVRDELVANWSSTQIWSLGRRHDADGLPAHLAEIEGRFAGLVTLNLDPGSWQCEVITLSARIANRGVGAALLDEAERQARRDGCRRIYLTTTNDNTHAMRFYQRRGWRFAALHRGIVDEVRARGVEIPLLGFDGIQVRDEIEFERWLE